MPVDTELYDLLGVSPNASEDEIKKAYRKKAKEHHPVQNRDDPGAAARFQEMAAAYEILSQPETKGMYDQFGMEGLSGGRGGGMDPNDIFQMFGGFSFGFDSGPGGFGSARRKKGQDSVIPYEVTLEDLYNGKSVKMNLEKDALCSVCSGSGAKGNAKPKKCVKCEGKGWTFVHSQVGRNQIGTSRAMCTECDGQGEKLREKDRCKKCKGSRTVKEKTRQELSIERGMANQQRIILAGAGDEEPGIPPGDVVFVLKQTPHDSFQRSGNDLLTAVHITLSEALFGFSRILVTHLDGRGIHVSSPPGKIIKPGESIVAKGEGMPVYKHPDTRGDLYIVFRIDMPGEEWLNTVDRAQLEALLPPKRVDVEPRPAVVDEAQFELSDIADARGRAFPTSSDFFDHGDEDEWEDDDDDDDDDEPECRTQ
ncbi:DnaJ-domain-containing protein [Thelephora terrestris]|uniref:DnaJ-domain-containing protein n=1 Tax=Thelephora terrestris TaxID=56493 RepID=A0A9P6HMR3_9AGAM|nr:DnaJ-domain-containing protein [Thelephora terrestris]